MKTRFLAGGALISGAVFIVIGLVSALPTASATYLQIAQASTGAQPEPFTDQACLNCHTDQGRLTELAVEEEVIETPSEGPG